MKKNGDFSILLIISVSHRICEKNSYSVRRLRRLITTQDFRLHKYKANAIKYIPVERG